MTKMFPPPSGQQPRRDFEFENAILRAQLSSARRRAAAAEARADNAEREARTDKLTAITNRKGLDEAISRENSRIQRGESIGAALLFFDLDKFKQTNDTFGHPTGDAVLKTVADALDRKTRDIDTVGRYGGDEFVVLLTNITPDMADKKKTQLTEKLNTLYAEHVLHRDAKSKTFVFVPIQGSCGMAMMDGIRDLETIKAESDADMYAAKAVCKGKAPR